MKDLIERQAAIDVILADKIDNKSLKVMDALGNGNEAKTLNMTCDRHAELLKSLPSAQPEPCADTVSRTAAIEAQERIMSDHPLDGYEDGRLLINALKALPSVQTDLITKIQNGIKATNIDDAYSCGMRNGMRWCISLIDDKDPLYENCPSEQPESTRTFVELVVEYPDPELCTYKKYRGKPYYSVKYIENGETYVGYGTYNPEVLSQYLKEYFISSVQPEITPDGTLTVSIDADIANVGRILLSQAGTQRGGLYYKDEQPEETCDTCKYGYFGDGKCDNCRERYPSHYERRTDEPGE